MKLVGVINPVVLADGQRFLKSGDVPLTTGCRTYFWRSVGKQPQSTGRDFEYFYTVSAQLPTGKNSLNPEEQTDFEQLSGLTDFSDKS
jgi:hypothetical protein